MTTVFTGALFLLCLLAVLVAVGLFIVVVRGARLLRERRRNALTDPLRGTLLELTCEEDPEGSEAAGLLAGLDRRRWRALEPMAMSLLGKVSGRARTALIDLFEHHGAAARARAALRRGGPVRRARAAELLGTLGRSEVAPALIPLLRSRDPDLRTVAARALGRLGDVVAVPALLDSLGPHRRVPPPVVTQALVRLGPAAQSAISAGLGHPQALARAVAIDALAAIGALGQTDAVVGAITGDPSPEVRIRAAQALGFLGMPGGLEPLLDATGPGRPDGLRAAAAEALGIMGAVSAVPSLRGLLDDPSHRVANAAGEALLRLGPAGHRALEDAAGGGTGARAAAHATAMLAAAALPAAAAWGSPPDQRETER